LLINGFKYAWSASQNFLDKRRFNLYHCFAVAGSVLFVAVIAWEDKPTMFERFTDKAVKAIMLAQEEARRLGHNFVGTEQLLLGLVSEKTSAAAKVLAEQGVTLQAARQEVEKIIGRGSGFVPAQIPFTPLAKQVFQAALEEAQRLDHTYIAPEHLLLGLTQEETRSANAGGVAGKVLHNLGVDPHAVHDEVLHTLEAEPILVGANRERTFGQQRGSKSPTLEEFGINLTQRAAEGQLDPLVGRQQEIERTVQILGRRTKNNPVLLGEPGVGKTAIAEGLAQRIVSGDVPELLADKQVVSLDMGTLVAGTRFRGEFEERLKQILEEVKAAGNIILVIDEIHTLVGAGALGGAMDAANLMKPALARGELQCLGATTLDEYRKHIERDAALERRFQPVKVGEPSVEETIEILQGLRPAYAEHHKVDITDAALVAAAQLSNRYISDRFLPDKAIDLMDEAGSRVHLRHSRLSEAGHPPQVNEEDIAQIVSSWTSIPVNKLSESESELLLHMEDTLHQRLIGQAEAVRAVARALRRARVGLKNPNRPIASFIFSGPTGVGKTELTKVLAASFFGSEEAIIRLDMSEYMEPHTVSKLLGSPPGFVGYEEGGQLTEAVRRRPYAVVLFDEIEKAHPDVFNLLLQLLEDGRLTDAKGRTVDFKNTLLIMTSNIGSRVIEKSGGGLGFEFGTTSQAEAQYQRIQSLVHDELKQYFRPEFLNRLDEIIVFQQLTKAEVKEIADLMLQEIQARLQEQDMHLVVTERFKEYAVDQGYSPVYGARPLRRVLTNLLEDNLAEAILAGQLQPGMTALVEVDEQNQVQVRSTTGQQVLAEAVARR
jgi:ATP-dependent Clp protease ATP-binding subunit ClpC